MEKPMIIKLIVSALLVVGYIIVTAFNLRREVIDPIIVVLIAVTLFFPVKNNTQQQ